MLRLDDLHHLTLKPHNLRLLLETIVHEHQANAALRQQKLVIEAQELPPVPINAEQFQRAISNIVTNAINYTPVGGTIRVSLEQDKQQAIVKVMDTGIGIAKEDIPHIFQRFYRVDKARSTDSGGTGLGLTIAKRIIELHDGEIIVESELGKGTCVAITVPV